ncbi:MAG: hypothetical protein Fur0039_22030 [Rhodocyclaceae bacterium]
MVVALALLPPGILGTGAPSGRWPGGYPGEVGWNLYQLVKLAMLWVPAGYLFALLGRERVLRRLALVAGSALLLVALPLGFFLPGARQAVVLLFAIPGLATGTWLGRRSGRFRSGRAPVNHPAVGAPSGANIDRMPGAFAAEAAPTPAARAPVGAPSGENLARAQKAFAAEAARTTTGRRQAPVGAPSGANIDRMPGAFAAEAAPARPAAPAAGAAPWRPGIAVAVRRLLAAASAAAAAALVWDFPLARGWLALVFALYLALLWRRPDAWLVAVPAALPVFSLAFWSGRFFFDEFDALVLLTLAAALWRGAAGTRPPRQTRGLLALLALSVAASTLVGLLPLAPLDENAFSSYWSRYNSLRIAKGFVEAVALFWIAGPLAAPERFRPFALGMTSGLAAASLVVVWEAWLFTGFGTASDYRATGSFASMHTGGGHIEAYLVAALPFAWALTLFERRPALRIFAAGAFLLGMYAVLATVARGGIGAVGVLSLVLGLGLLVLARRSHGARWKLAGAAAVVAAGLGVVAGGIHGGEYLRQRFTHVLEDAQVRLAHAGKTLAMIDGSASAWAFGMGLGSFPRTHVLNNLDEQPGSYRLEREGGRVHLTLNSGGTLYWAQAVEARPHTRYTFEADLKTDGHAERLEIALCEKILFNSARCAWSGTRIDASVPGWQHRAIAFDSGEVGSGPWWKHRPVQFSLYNPQRGTSIGIAAVRLHDGAGNELLANGDFARGADRWFFKSGNHLPWHVKNLWLHALFEQGLLGLTALGALVAVALARLVPAAWRGETASITLLAVLCALLTLGFVESFLDAPRLALLLIFLLLAGTTAREEPG